MDGAKIKALDKQYHMHSWSVQKALDTIVFDHGKGAEFWDMDGKRYLDFSSQLMNLNTGHQHPKVIEAIKKQADKCMYCMPGFSYESRSLLAEKLAKYTPANINHFFFTLGGAESNENAIKMSRLYTGAHKIIARYRSYHGASMGAITLTGDSRRWPVEAGGIPGVLRVFDPYCYRCSFGLEYPSCNLRCAEHVREVMEYEGAKDHVAAMFVEGVTGTNGIIVPPPEYYPRLREICDEFDVLLVADEVMSGFGRTGKWFALDNWGVKPDLMTMAKGITSGYLPLGVVGVSDEIAEYFSDKMLWCGLTYNAHPMSCAAAIATMEVFEEENLVERSQKMGEIMAIEMDKMKEKHACVGDARGIGMFRLLELVKDKKTKEPITPFNVTNDLSKAIGAKLKEYGMSTFVHWHKIHMSPPLVITEEQLREGLQIVDRVLDFVDSQI